MECLNEKDKIVINDLQYTILDNTYEEVLNGDLPSDTVRVYVPMDMSSDLLKSELHFIHSMLGDVNEDNEYEYSLFMSRLISKVEIYTQYQDGKDSFPYSEIERLRKF